MAEFNAKQQLPGLLDWMRAQMKALSLIHI